MEVSMTAIFTASEDDARDFTDSQRVKRSADGGDLLVPDADLLPRRSASPHGLSSMRAHAKHPPQARLERCLRRALASSIKPVFKVLYFDDVRHFRMADFHLDGRQPSANIADPVLSAQCREGLRDRLIRRLGRHFKGVRGFVEIVNDDGAGIERHDCTLSYFVICSLL
jgi:hypothetical protein